MRKFKHLLLALICFSACGEVLATASGMIRIEPSHRMNLTATSQTRLRQKQPAPQPNKPSRPNAPSRVFIDCYYADGVIEFEFPEGISALNVTIANDSGMWVATVTPELPALLIDGITGNITIECTAPDGRTFIGNIIL